MIEKFRNVISNIDVMIIFVVLIATCIVANFLVGKILYKGIKENREEATAEEVLAAIAGMYLIALDIGLIVSIFLLIKKS